MKLFMILALGCLNSYTFGQNAVRLNGLQIIGPAKTSAQQTIDSVKLKCYYTFSKKKATETQPYRTDTMVLEIGERISRFYDPARIGRDSLLSARMNNMGAESIKSVTVFKGEKAKDLSPIPGTISSPSADGESYQIFKDLSTGKTTVIDYVSAIGDKFSYEDVDSKMNWKIDTATDTIQGYPCQKAFLNFRGRDYVAWFTSEIPLQDGPWKFKGLPGLILSVEDTQTMFSFQLIGLEQLTKQVPIITQNPKKMVTCTREEFEKQKKKQGAGTQINLNAGNLIIAELPGNYDYVSMEIQ
ncbi:GLPGLI family protein [Pedobacter sp. AW31-3R]|uniref:GLPGLI family protein n=1 Tax=Pedobacter sp. AW31-3R TaxID=3445781 RepID=UPI003F9EDB11